MSFNKRLYFTFRILFWFTVDGFGVAVAPGAARLRKRQTGTSLQILNIRRTPFLVDSTLDEYSFHMSRLNKRALYQMATKNTNAVADIPMPRVPVSGLPSTGNSVPEFSGRLIEFRPVSETPDGRLSGKITAPALTKVEVDDDASVSSRARRAGKDGLEGFKRHEVLQKLGSGSLGMLTNAYLEQQIMYDDEIHTVQQRFYGLRSV